MGRYCRVMTIGRRDHSYRTCFLKTVCFCPVRGYIWFVGGRDELIFRGVPLTVECRSGEIGIRAAFRAQCP